MTASPSPAGQGLVDALKPCPFCGAEADMEIAIPCHYGWKPHCTECEASAGSWRHEADAVAAWNIRAALSSERKQQPVAEAEGYRRGVEDAAKVANAEADSYALHCDRYSRDVAESITAAIRSLPAGKGDAA